MSALMAYHMIGKNTKNQNLLTKNIAVLGTIWMMLWI